MLRTSDDRLLASNLLFAYDVGCQSIRRNKKYQRECNKHTSAKYLATMVEMSLFCCCRRHSRFVYCKVAESCPIHGCCFDSYLATRTLDLQAWSTNIFSENYTALDWACRMRNGFEHDRGPLEVGSSFWWLRAEHRNVCGREISCGQSGNVDRNP